MLYFRGVRVVVVVEADADTVAERAVVRLLSPCYVCLIVNGFVCHIVVQSSKIDHVPSASEVLLNPASQGANRVDEQR